MKKYLHAATILLCIVPVAYLLFVLPQLPAIVPTHYGMDGTPDRWESKQQFLVITIILSAVSALIYLLLCHIWRIDPKKKSFENKERLQKIGFAMVAFMAVIQTYMIYNIKAGIRLTDPKFIFIATGIFFSIMGNYMDNLKPNYFAGFRLPWALENEDNWRKTHHLASKVWFVGGLLMAACFLIAPFKTAIVIFFIIAFIIVAIPAVYSYQLYKKNKQNFAS